jgi:pimeloyl-ACP methyl ester carboxylesterase
LLRQLDAGEQRALNIVHTWRHRAKLAFSQRKVLFPGSALRGSADVQVFPEVGTQLQPLATGNGDRIAALFGSPLAPFEVPGPRPTVLFLYGNDMSMKRGLPIFNLLRRTGANVLMPEYIGYGMSDGVPSERNCYATADAAYKHLMRRPDVDPSRIIVCGCSLGGAVAIDLASRHKLAGLATVVTFTKLADLARQLFPWLPVSLMLRYRFDNLAKMPKITCPTLIGHSTGDELVPYEMADRLAAAAGGPVTRLSIADAGHSVEQMMDLAGEAILGALRGFVRDCVAI